MKQRFANACWWSTLILILLFPFVDSGVHPESDITQVLLLPPCTQMDNLTNSVEAVAISKNQHGNFVPAAPGSLKMGLSFIRNDGQLDKNVRYYLHSHAGSVFITDQGNIVHYLCDKMPLSSWYFVSDSV